MDLESYIARYSGETRLQRLLLVAQTTSDEALASQAYHLAEQQMKVNGNVKKYKEIFGQSSSNRQAGQSAVEEVTQSAGENADFRKLSCGREFCYQILMISFNRYSRSSTRAADGYGFVATCRTATFENVRCRVGNDDRSCQPE